MTLATLDSLPGGARLWIFGADRPLAPEEERTIRSRMASFLEAWTAHRQELVAASAVSHGRFLMVALDESSVPASGCSIDALVGAVKGLEAEVGTPLADAAPVWYRTDRGEVACVSRAEFRRLAEEGSVDGDTPVFDLTVDKLDKVRDGSWERPARESWHASLLARAGSGPGRRFEAGGGASRDGSGRR